MRFFAVFFLVVGCAAGPETHAPVVAAPDNPDTEIFVGSIAFADGAPSISALDNATDRKGYDNQPYFLAGEAAFFYVAEGESGKTDIRLFDIARGASQPVFTSSEMSEYSPKEAPMGGLSYIQENPEGDVTRVHRRALDGDDAGAAVVDFAPLGYYAWLDGGAALGVYYRSDPGSLYRVDVASDEASLVREKIGRTLQSDSAGGHLWFSELPDAEDGALSVARYDSAGGALTRLFDLPDGATDFFIVADQNGAALGCLAGSGAKAYWRAADGAAWTVVADLESLGAAAISRIAVSDDRRWIAIVAEMRN